MVLCGARALCIHPIQSNPIVHRRGRLLTLRYVRLRFVPAPRIGSHSFARVRAQMWGSDDPADTTRRKNFAEAAEDCRSMNGVLTSIDSDFLNNYIRQSYQCAAPPARPLLVLFSSSLSEL